MNVSMLATLMGSYCVHSPPAPRNVGMPLSAEMPAPVRATPRVAAFSSSAARAIGLPSGILVAGRLGGEHQLPPVLPPDRGIRLGGGLGRKRHPGRAHILADGHDLEHAELVRRLALQLQAGDLLHRDVVATRVERRLPDAQ